MSLLLTINNALKRLPELFPYKRLPVSSAGVTFSSGNWYSETRRTPYELAANAWAYSCIRLRANALYRLKFRAYKDLSQAEATLLPLDHWLTQLLNNPNNYYVRYHFYTLISQYIDIVGNAFLYVRRVPNIQTPVDMWLLPPATVEIVSSPTAFVQGYIVHIEHHRVPFDASEIIHFRDLHAQPGDRYLHTGKGKIEVLSEVLNLDATRMTFFRNYLNSDGVPPLALKSELRWEEGQWREFKENFNRLFPQPKLKLLLENNNELTPLVSNSTEIAAQMRAGNLSEELVEQICGVFGMTASYVRGKYENRASAEVHENRFYETAVEPLADYIDEEFTRHFKQYDSTLLVEHEPHVVRSVDFELEKTKQLFAMGAISRNEIRQREGLPPIEDGDVFLLPNNLASADTILHPVEVADTVPETRTVSRAARSAAKRIPLEQIALFDDSSADEVGNVLFWRSWDARNQVLRQALEKRCRTFLKSLEREVQSNLSSATTLRGVRSKDFHTKSDGLEALFDVREWIRRFVQLVTPDLEREIENAYRKAVEDVGGNWAEVRPALTEQMRQTLQTSLDKIKTSVETISEELKRELSAIIADNADRSVDELQRIIEEAVARRFVVLQNGRARNIAQTTATVAMGNAQRVVYDELGYDAVWLTQRDGSVRQTHFAADGQHPDSEGMFTVGTDRMRHPGGGSQAKENCYCRCVLRPRPKQQ